MSKINKYLPKEHPTRKVFRKKRIPICAVAKYLERSTNYTCSILNGGMRATPEIDRKLSQFAKMVMNTDAGEVPIG